MAVEGWFIVLLALVGVNVPFLNQRLFADVNRVCWTGSHTGGVLSHYAGRAAPLGIGRTRSHDELH
jgi:hypothetical protein